MSRKQIEQMGLDPDHQETKEIIASRERPTMMPCPAKCNRCECCHGLGMVTSEQAAEWLLKRGNGPGDTL